MPERTLQRIIKRAAERGFDPANSQNWLEEWFLDAFRPGRPSKQSGGTVNEFNRMVRLDRYAREKTRDEIAPDLGKLGMNASPTTIRRMLKASGNRKTKSTWLSPKMKQARLEWYLERERERERERALDSG